jgi:tetratricopeptide (TPR) repeat protein
MMKTIAVFISIFMLITGTACAAGLNLPPAAGICVGRAVALAEKGKTGQAIDLLEKFNSKKTGKTGAIIMARGYDHYYIHFLLGNYYLMLARDDREHSGSDRYARAIEHFKDSLDRNHGFSPAWLNLAIALYETSMFAKAAEAFEKGYETSDHPEPVHLYYASVCRLQAGAARKAFDTFTRLMKDHPDKITLQWKETFVSILFRLKRFRQALPYIEELAVKSVGTAHRKWEKILLHQYMSLNMNQKALDYARTLAGSDPVCPEWWKALCHIYLDKNLYEKGLTSLIIYGYLAPMTREELRLEADLYRCLNIPDRASEIYRQIRTLESSSAKP